MARKYYTILEWSSLLAPDVREKLLAGMKAQLGPRLDARLARRAASLRMAIDYAFTWAATPEGHGFWSEQHSKAGRDERTPDDLRGHIDCTIPEGDLS